MASTPNKIPDHNFENGLLLDQTEDDPINDEEIDEAILLEIDQTMKTNTTNDTNTHRQQVNENNLFDVTNLNDSIIENYPNTLQAMYEYLTMEQHETNNNKDDSGIHTQITTPWNHNDCEGTSMNTYTEQQDTTDRDDMDIEKTNKERQRTIHHNRLTQQT